MGKLEKILIAAAVIVVGYLLLFTGGNDKPNYDYRGDYDDYALHEFLSHYDDKEILDYFGNDLREQIYTLSNIYGGHDLMIGFVDFYDSPEDVIDCYIDNYSGDWLIEVIRNKYQLQDIYSKDEIIDAAIETGWFDE